MDVQGYRALKLSSSSGVKADRYLYLRRHADKKEQNVLFVANLPPFCSRRYIEAIFGSCGEIKDVDVVPLNAHSVQTVAHVVFATNDGVSKALALNDSDVKGGADAGLTDVGLNRMLHAYRDAVFADRVVMQRNADESVNAFIKKVKDHEAALEQQASAVDEDGFTLVVGKGKRSRAESNGTVTVVKGTSRGVEKRKKKEKVLVDFYRFQERERKREQLAKIRVQFEKDKQRIAKMKESRKFKPF